MVSGDLLNRLSAPNCLHGDPGLELITVRQALVQLLLFEKPSATQQGSPMGGALLRGGVPPQRLTMALAKKARPLQVHVLYPS
jgi:hypothetical protein